MDSQAIHDYLRDNLKINITTSSYDDWGSKGIRTTVTVLLRDEPIASDSDTFDLAYRDTSENWRGPFD